MGAEEHFCQTHFLIAKATKSLCMLFYFGFWFYFFRFLRVGLWAVCFSVSSKILFCQLRFFVVIRCLFHSHHFQILQICIKNKRDNYFLYLCRALFTTFRNNLHRKLLFEQVKIEKWIFTKVKSREVNFHKRRRNWSWDIKCYIFSLMCFGKIAISYHSFSKKYHNLLL